MTPASNGYQLETIAADGSSLLELMENNGAEEWRFDLLGQDATFGNPVPITEVISSLMTDGGLTTIKSFGNRVAVFLLTITATDTAALAYGEAELMAALNSTTALAWHAPIGFPSYFDVVACWSEHEFDDFGEADRCRRRYRLTFECLPFARSENSTVIEWAAPGLPLSPLSSYSGWTTISGTTPTVTVNDDDPAGSQFLLTGTVTFESPPVLLDEYLWIKANDASIVGVSIDGTIIPTSSWRNQLVGGARRFYTIPTKAWRGQTLPVRFVSMTGRLYEFYSTSYPTKVGTSGDLRPRGVGAIDVGGSARTQCVISFTVPAGGAFVITGPDPNELLRDRGVGESVFAHFTATAPTETTIDGRVIRHEVGTHSRGIGFTDPQPVVLNPDGIWPEIATGPLTGASISAGAAQYAYPNDPYGRISVTFIENTGAATLISPGIDLPTGYAGETAHHEQHALYPGRSLFAVLDSNGYPIPATITYFKRWKHHAAE